MAEQHVTLRVGQKGAEGVSAAAKKVERSWLDTAAKLAIVGQVATRAFSAIARSMAEPMKAAAKFAKDSAQLDVALSRLGQDVDKTRASFDSFASELQRTAGVSMDTVTSMQRLWVQLTGNADGANKATRAAMELSAVLGIDGTSAMRMMSQAAEGNVQTLARYVPAVRDLTQEQIKAGKAIDLVAEKFGGALSANMDNVAGQWERLNNIIMDRYREASSLAIIQNEAITAGLKQLGSDLIALAPNYENVGQLAKELAIMAANALSGLAFLAGGIATSINSVMEVLNKVVEIGLTPIMKMLDGLIMIWRKAGQYLGLPDGVLEGFDLLGQTLKDIVRAPLTIGESVEFMSGKVADMSSTAVGLLDRVSDAMTRTAVSTKKASDNQGDYNGKLREMKELVIDLGDMSDLFAAEEEAMRRRMSRIDQLSAYRKWVIDKTADYEENRARELDAALTQIETERERRMQAGVASMMRGAQTLGAAMIAVADGAMTAADAVRAMAATAANAMIDSVLAIVQAKLVEAMVSAMAGASGIPIVGLAVGAAAAAAVAGAIKALIAKIERPRGYYFGGTATGGIPGRDSVPAMLRPDERVLTPHQAQQQASIAAMAGGGSSGEMHVTIYTPLGMGDSVAVMRDLERAIIPALERAASTGRLSRTLALAGAR